MERSAKVLGNVYFENEGVKYYSAFSFEKKIYYVGQPVLLHNSILLDLF